MKFIKLPFKYSLIYDGTFIGLDYVPEGADKNEPLLLVKRVFNIKIPFRKQLDPSVLGYIKGEDEKRA